MSGADTAFDFLSDPVRLPEYVPALRLDDSTAVEGELDVDADLRERDGAPDAGFSPTGRHDGWSGAGLAATMVGRSTSRWGRLTPPL